MAVLPIYIYDDPVLRKKAKQIRHADDGLVRLSQDMFETMRKASGVGLAANQVGLLQRIIVVDISCVEETKDVPPLALVNPEVVREEGKLVMEEGCLSIPEIREDVERAEEITVRFKDLEFRDQVLDADGLLARVILHEIDHLNAVLFIDRIGAVRRKLLRGRLNKIRRGELDVAYPVVCDGMALKTE